MSESNKERKLSPSFKGELFQLFLPLSLPHLAEKGAFGAELERDFFRMLEGCQSRARIVAIQAPR